MPVNFTDSPSNGDTLTAGGRTYTYDSTAGVWDITSTSGGGGDSAAGGGTLTATASGSLANGDLVLVNSDGSVSAVSQTSSSAGVGSATVFESAPRAWRC